MIKYYCSKHSMNLTGTISRAYGKHKCYCGKSAKFQVEESDKINGLKVESALIDELHAQVSASEFENPNHLGQYFDNSEPTKPIEDGIDDWEYENKDKIWAVMATFYIAAFAGACWAVYKLATMTA